MEGQLVSELGSVGSQVLDGATFGEKRDERPTFHHSGLETAALPRAMTFTQDIAPVRVSREGNCGVIARERTAIDSIAQFAEEHPKLFWSGVAVTGFGIAATASALTASSGGVALPALAATAKFVALLGTAMATNNIVPVFEFLRKQS